MATTANTVLPIAALGGQGGTEAAQSGTYIATDGAIVKGDILIIASGKVDELNVDPTTLLIVGVANEPSTATDDELNVLEALPGRRFEANLVATSTTDLASGVFATHCGVQFGFTEADGDSLAAIDVAETGAVRCRTRNWARQKNSSGALPAQVHTPFAATLAIVNPRVEFVFIAIETIFGT